MLSIPCSESLAWLPALRTEKLLAVRLGRLSPSKVVWVMGDFETPAKLLVSHWDVDTWKMFIEEGREHCAYLRGSARPIVHYRFRHIQDDENIVDIATISWSAVGPPARNGGLAPFGKTGELPRTRETATRSAAVLHKRDLYGSRYINVSAYQHVDDYGNLRFLGEYIYWCNQQCRALMLRQATNECGHL
jgi:hypothetical protein